MIAEDIVVNVKANAAQATAEMKKVEKAATEMGKKLEGSTSGFGASVGTATSRLAGLTGAMGTLGIAVGVAAGAMKLLKEGLDLATETAQMRALERALPTGAIERLKDATRGLVAEERLVQLATKGMTGDFALSAEKMGVVLQAARALEQQNRGTAESITDQLLSALAKGGRGFKDLGIEIQKGETALKALERVAAAATPMDADLERLKKWQAGWADTWDAVKDGAGDAIIWLVKVNDELNRMQRDIPLLNLLTGSNEEWNKYYSDRISDRIARNDNGAEVSRSLSNPDEFAVAKEDGSLQEMVRQRREAAAQARRSEHIDRVFGINRKKGSGKSGPSIPLPAHIMAAQMQGAHIDQQGWATEEYDLDQTLVGAGSMGTPLDQLFGGDNVVTDMEKQAQAAKKVAAAMEDLKDPTTAAGMAFQTFSQGLAGGIEAAIEGGESIPRAMAKAAAGALKSIAVQAGVNATWETAQGLGKLALGDVASATTHFASAGKYLAAAGAAGLGAATLGSMAGGGGSSDTGERKVTHASRPEGFQPPGHGGDEGGNVINVFFGDGFVGKPEEVARSIEEIRNKGLRRSRITESRRVRYS